MATGDFTTLALYVKQKKKKELSCSDKHRHKHFGASASCQCWEIFCCGCLMELRFSPGTKVLIITTTVASRVRWEWSKKVLPFTHLYAIAARYYLATKATSFIPFSAHFSFICVPPAHEPSCCASAILPWGYVDRPGAYTLLTWACNPVVYGFITRPVKD